MIPEWSGFTLRFNIFWIPAFSGMTNSWRAVREEAPYNDNGNSTSGQHHDKSGQPHGVAPTLGELENWKEKGKVLKFIVVGLIWGGLLFGNCVIKTV